MLALLIPTSIAETLFFIFATCGAFIPPYIWRLCANRGITSRYQGKPKERYESFLKFTLWAGYAALLIGVWQYSVSVHQVYQADDASAFRESFVLLGDSFDYRFRDGRAVHIRRQPHDHCVIINDSAQTLTLTPIQYSARYFSPPRPRPATAIRPDQVFHFDNGIWLFGSESPPKSITESQHTFSREFYWLKYSAPSSENSTIVSRMLPILLGVAAAYAVYRLSHKRITIRMQSVGDNS
jgi:hypothetical protein